MISGSREGTRTQESTGRHNEKHRMLQFTLSASLLLLLQHAGYTNSPRQHPPRWSLTSTHLVMEDCVELLSAILHHWGVVQILQKLTVAAWVKPLWRKGKRERQAAALDNFLLNLEKNMQDGPQPCSNSLCHDLWKYSRAINQISTAGSTAFESNNSLWLWLYTLLNAFCHLLHCSLRLVELHERNWPFAKEITISWRAR